MFNDDIDPERLQRVFDQHIWLLLAKVNSAGAVLGTAGKARLQTLEQQYPYLKLATDGSDEFPFWTGKGVGHRQLKGRE